MTPSCVALGRVIICDLNFKRTENHNFTITTNTSQHVEFFHSLIFNIFLQSIMVKYQNQSRRFQHLHLADL